MNLTDQRQDARIRAALKSAKENGQLQVVSAVTGVSIKAIRKIIDSTDEIDSITRAALAMHLP